MDITISKTIQLKSKILLIGLLGCLSGCHSDYVNLDFIVDYGAISQVDDHKIAFIGTSKAFHAPEGISRFPDGGQVKMLLEERRIYLYDLEKEELMCLKNQTWDEKPPWYMSNTERLVLIDSLLYYQCIIDTLKSISQDEFKMLQKKYTNTYLINIYTKKVNNIDSAVFNKIYDQHYKKSKVDLTGLDQIPMAAKGLVLKEIYPKSDNEYIKDLILWQDVGSEQTRRAIVEQIILRKSKSEIKNILQKIDDYKEKLDTSTRQEYEFWRQDTYDYIQSMLDRN